MNENKKGPLFHIVKRPEISLKDLEALMGEGEIPPPVAEQTEIAVKYEGYLQKQEVLIQKARQAEETLLREDIPYDSIEGLRLEARQKLLKQKPVSLGAAGRIPGVNPADVSVLSVWLEKEKRMKKAAQESAE